MPELPCGTVTFLFTDIEGSTALWERDRQAMAAAVERHLALLGDGHQPPMAASTSRPSAMPCRRRSYRARALAAAVDGQRALLLNRGRRDRIAAGAHGASRRDR